MFYFDMSRCREIQEKYDKLISDRRRFKAIDMKQKPRTELLALKESISKFLHEFIGAEYELGGAKVEFLPITVDNTRRVGKDVRIDHSILRDYSQVMGPMKNMEGKNERQVAILVQFPEDKPFEAAPVRNFMKKYNLRFAYLRELLTCHDDYGIGGNKNGVVTFIDNEEMNKGVLLRNKNHWYMTYFGAPYIVMNSGKYLFVRK